MKYLYLELNGYERFTLNQMDHFSICIENPLQIILGTNGSGKSSLLSELSPLPAKSTDFTKLGSKIIKIEHNGLFVLKSIFFPSQKHSFIKDGIELNQGGTASVQRSLAKQYFDITPDIHGLMLGDETFTSMPTSRRKEWFIQLCDTNYDYAIKVYKKAADRHRDVVGALKIAKKKLVHESEKLIKSDEETKLKNETQILHDQLNQLLEYRKPIESDIVQLIAQKSTIGLQMHKCATSLNSILKTQGQERHLSDDKLTELINKFSGLIIEKQTLITAHSKEYNSNQEKINVLQKAEQQTISTLNDKIKSNTFLQSTLVDKMIHCDFIDADVAMNSFQSVKHTLIEIFSNLPSNEEKIYSNDNLSSAKATLSEYKIKKVAADSKLQSNLSKQKHMLMHKDKPDITCSNCNHRFSLHYNDAAHTEIEKEIVDLENSIAHEITPIILAQEKYIENCNIYSTYYRQYTQCISGFGILKPYWKYLAEKNTVTHNPLNGINELHLIENDLKLQIQFANTIKEYNELVNLKTSLMDVGGSDLNTLLQTNKTLQSGIDTHTDAFIHLSEMKSKYIDILSKNKEMKSLYDKIVISKDKMESLNKEEIETIRRTIFNEVIKTMQSQLANKEHILTSIKTQKSIIENTQVAISEMESEEIALSILVKQLSPVEGLIAEGLFGFIQSFLNEMNHFIKKIWAYPLTILPCELEDDNSVDLDYKFKMKVANGDNPVSDVKYGSNGMLEVINLAFKVVAVKYLKLQNVPLYLDEVGVKMDHSHKTELFKHIHDMIEQKLFSQVYIISHEFTHYGALTNADICVLNPLNIIVPKEYNGHVVMK